MSVALIPETVDEGGLQVDRRGPLSAARRNFPPKRKCNATSKRSKVRCKRWATPGFVKCRQHMGVDASVDIAPGTKTWDAMVVAIGLDTEDGSFRDLNRQIRLLCHMQCELAEGTTEANRRAPDYVELQRRLTETTVRTIAEQQKATQAEGEMVPVQVVADLMAALVDSINEHVKDAETRRALLEAFTGLGDQRGASAA